MKKLLVLALVLGMASFASASLSWDVSSVSVPLGGTATVYISSTTATYSNGPNFLGIYDAIADFASFTPVGTTSANPGAGDNAAAVKDDAGYIGYWTINADGNPDTLAAGVHWEVVINGLSLGTTTFYTDIDEVEGSKDPLTVNVVPEPMTIALLGLGGLFLRRRK